MVGSVAWFVAAPLVVDVFTDHNPMALVGLALVQLLGAGLLVEWWLRRQRLDRAAVGASTVAWKRDVALGAVTVLPRLALEFGVLVPLAGGVANEGVQEVLRNAEAGAGALAGALILGVVGGGLAEELYFRGFLIGGLPRVFSDRRRARRAAAVCSVLLFAALHLPSTWPDVVSILVAALTYTLLFLYTNRLTAPVAAHALWNAAAIAGVLAVYG